MFGNKLTSPKGPQALGRPTKPKPTPDPYALAATALQAANFRCGTPPPIRESQLKAAFAWPRLAQEALEAIDTALGALEGGHRATGLVLARRAGLEGLRTSVSARQVEIAFREIDNPNEWAFESDLERKFVLGKTKKPPPWKR